MAANHQNRRDFLKAGSAALAATTVSWNASSYAAIAGANDRVRVGVVGCGDRMKQSLIPSFLQHTKEMNFEFVAVSDLWNRRREEGVAYIE
ncbi:MAG TPA: twin-arginine translocation signal domain-containing protein, partial [Terracidiphilus sp.]|nr:twin-arginine translocation signal domain-containing protein [Terracidiphilus sp.]